MICIYFSKQWQAAVDILFTSIFDPEEIPYYKKTIVHSNSILMIDGNRVVGFLLLTHTSNGIHKYQLSYLGVDEKYRNKGIATKMLDMLDVSVWLEVLNSNTEAYNFYIKNNCKLYNSFMCKDGSIASTFTRITKNV